MAHYEIERTHPSFIKGSHKGRKWDKIVPAFLFVCTMISVLTTVGIVLTLVLESLPFFADVSVLQFLTTLRWSPPAGDFGILPLVSGTLLVTVLAMLVALPIGMMSAIYLSEYAPDRVRRIVKPVLEILAGIPTIVYGFFALTFVTPLLREMIPDMGLFNALGAGVVMGIMMIPLVSSLSEDAMSAVPRHLREAAFALGATRFEVAWKVVVPAALSGIISSFVLALSRAVGETMIVAIAAGATPKLTFSPLESIQTMTGYIVQVSGGDISYGSVDYKSIFAVGITLFGMTLLLNLLAQFIARRFKEDY